LSHDPYHPSADLYFLFSFSFLQLTFSPLISFLGIISVLLLALMAILDFW
jgi:hypothetical protein